MNTTCSAAKRVLFQTAMLVCLIGTPVWAGEQVLSHVVIEGKVTVEVEAPPESPRVIITSQELKPLDALLFQTDKAEPTPESISALEAVAKTLVRNPSMQVSIEAHTDDAATADYNQQLSRRRAEWVQGWLVSHGVAREAARAKGFGSTRPVASNATEEGRRLNRRVEFVITAH